MALFRFKCPQCNKEYKKLFKTESSITSLHCADDQVELVRDNCDAATTIYETIDNGLQIKRVTQVANSPELLKDRQNQSMTSKVKSTL